MVTVYSAKLSDVQKDVQKDVQNDVSKDVSKDDRASTLLSLLKEDPAITIDQLAQKCLVNIKTIQRDLERLKSNSSVRRVGGRKNGHWEVNLTT
jgi:ATP-dependent DNA helicase RecG